MSSDQLEDVMSAINEMGINIVENEEAGEDGEPDKSDDDEVEAVDAGDGTPAPPEAPTKKETIDRPDEPVRRYMRQLARDECAAPDGRPRTPKATGAGSAQARGGGKG